MKIPRGKLNKVKERIEMLVTKTAFDNTSHDKGWRKRPYASSYNTRNVFHLISDLPLDFDTH